MSMLDTKPIVVKVGGSELDDENFLKGFASAVAALNRPVVVVHGGGKEISTFQELMSIKPQYVDGVRITDAPSLAIVEMVLCGTVNKRLVRYFLNAGVDAFGLSGVDRGLVRAEKMQHPDVDMGFTGAVVAVRGDVLLDLLAQGITPVLAPVSAGTDSNFNVNADHVAGAVAGAIGAERLIFMTAIGGVMIGEEVISVLTPEETERLIADGTISGGMIPKVRTAIEALEKGAQEAVITNLQGLATGGGTAFRRERVSVGE